jgi:adenylate cyclase
LNKSGLINKDISEIDYIFGKGKLEQMINDAKASSATIDSEMSHGSKLYKIKAVVYNDVPQIIIGDVTLENLLKSNVDPSVIRDLNEKGVNVFKHENKDISVLFGDIRGFTKYVEGAKPDDVSYVLTDYLTEMTDVIFRNSGTFDKSVGDMIMGLFGAPQSMQNHADIAVRSAIEMQECQKKLKEKWSKEGNSPLCMGIGINTGYALVGPFGSKKRNNYTAIGNTINLGNRACGAAEPDEILITQDTYERLCDKLDFKDIGEKTFKGITKPVRIYSKKI